MYRCESVSNAIVSCHIRVRPENAVLRRAVIYNLWAGTLYRRSTAKLRLRQCLCRAVRASHFYPFIITRDHGVESATVTGSALGVTLPAELSLGVSLGLAATTLGRPSTC